MKKIFLLITLSLSSLLLTSCLSDYLDVSPESGLTEKDVFTKLVNFRKFFDVVYSDYGDYAMAGGFGLHWNFSTQKISFDGLTDNCDMGRIQQGQAFKGGTMYPSGLIYSYKEAATGELFGFFESSWKAIRVANIALQKVDEIQNATAEEKADLRAQAYFVRGFCHFTLMRSWGPMPYLTKSLGPDDQWDIPQLSRYDGFVAIAADMDRAIEQYKIAGTMRRDGGPGSALHLIDPNMFRPNGCAAAALKARALLYAASPLNIGANDPQVAWAAAANANWEAIQTALSNSYELLPWANFKNNFNGAKYSNEQIYGWNAGTNNGSSPHLQYLLPGVFNNGQFNSGECPTQNMVDKFETAWGDPLITKEERDAATALGHYNEQDPYSNRDPRFDFSIIHNQSPLPGTWVEGKAQIWSQVVGGSTVYGEIIAPLYTGVTQTGYISRKRWGGESLKNNVTGQYTDPVIRLGELYLNYAEAVNEAYGPNGAAPGASLSAVAAVNIIRSRAGMPDVLSKFTSDKDEFRKRIKNERTIELSFEGQYYYDIRRWMDAPALYSSPLMAISVTKVSVTPEFPTGYMYSRIELPANRQIAWSEGKYYFTFIEKDYRLMSNFVFGPKW